jgi:hypothetical protein
MTRGALGKDADLIIGADVIYTPETANAFVPVLNALLRASGHAQAIVAYSKRSEATDQAFTESLRVHSLQVVRTAIESSSPLPISIHAIANHDPITAGEPHAQILIIEPV